MDFFGLGKAWSTLIAVLAAAAVVAGIGYMIHRWDEGRLNARYNAGRNDERALWEAGQALATKRQSDAVRDAAIAAEQAGDTMRAGSTTIASQAATATQADIDTITKAHADAKTPACSPDASPVALPPGVLDALERARDRASRAAAATAR